MSTRRVILGSKIPLHSVGRNVRNTENVALSRLNVTTGRSIPKIYEKETDSRFNNLSSCKIQFIRIK